MCLAQKPAHWKHPQMTAIVIILCPGFGQALRSLGQVKDLSLHGAYDKELRFRVGDGQLEADVREGVMKRLFMRQ